MEKQVYNTLEIMEVIPHRYPFLLIDRVTEINETGGKGYKNVTANEEFFNGHFPGNPVMPGVLQLEGMAQCCCFVAMKHLEEAENIPLGQKSFFFMKIDGAKFRRPVRPGDRLDYEIEFLKMKKNVGVFAAKASVDGQPVCEATFTAMYVDNESAKEK